MSQTQILDGQDEPELVELHFELEIDYAHAFQQDQVITTCIADVMNVNQTDVFFDGVDEIEKDDQYFGLFRGHIPTTKHEIEKLVSIFYNSLQSNVLQQKIMSCSAVNGTPMLEIRELYETDQNDEDDQYQDIHDQDMPDIDDSFATMETQQYSGHGNEAYNIQQQQQKFRENNTLINKHSNDPNSVEAMLYGLKELLNDFIQDTDTQFDQLLQNCQKQMKEEF
eukprot:UN13655